MYTATSFLSNKNKEELRGEFLLLLKKGTNKMIKAVLFDLDGTLLPLDQNEFIGAYFKGLIRALLPLGRGPKELEGAVWNGTYAMIKNNGEKNNEAAFFDYFTTACPDVDMDAFRDLADNYYRTEYQKLIALTRPTPLAREAVSLARKGGRKVVLATNPLFPEIAQHTRIRFAGLEPEDFDFVTTYEFDIYAKPNPKYYLSVCERLGISPEECLMIGNDEREDMYAASSVGMSCYLIDDCALRSEEHPWTGEHGTFAELVEKLKSL